MSATALQKVRAIDVRPYRWALWCSVGNDARPLANPIVYRGWNSDGSYIVFGLDSRHSMSAKPDDELELVSLTPTYQRPDDQAEFVDKRPKPTRECAACGGAGRVACGEEKGR